MGELELAIWATEMRGGGEVLANESLGWGGDRVRVTTTPAGPALVLYTVWDDSTAARRFATGPGARFEGAPRPGYRTTVVRLVLDGRSMVRVIRAPIGWDGWAAPPRVELQSPVAKAPSVR
jgi:hypothetical protein